MGVDVPLVLISLIPTDVGLAVPRLCPFLPPTQPNPPRHARRQATVRLCSTWPAEQIQSRCSETLNQFSTSIEFSWNTQRWASFIMFTKRIMDGQRKAKALYYRSHRPNNCLWKRFKKANINVKSSKLKSNFGWVEQFIVTARASRGQAKTHRVRRAVFLTGP